MIWPLKDYYTHYDNLPPDEQLETRIDFLKESIWHTKLIIHTTVREAFKNTLTLPKKYASLMKI